MTAMESAPHHPVVLIDEIQVQPGGVVSKVVARADTGSLTLFAFDGGEGLDEHSTPSTAMVLVLEGTLRIRLGGEDHTVAQGEMLALPPGKPHAVRAPEPAKMLLVLFKAP